MYTCINLKIKLLIIYIKGCQFEFIKILVSCCCYVFNSFQQQIYVLF